MANMKFRLGLLDGIQDRQNGLSRDVEKLGSVKGEEYKNGYIKGFILPQEENKNAGKGNRK